MAEAAHDVLRPVRLHFHEAAVVEDLADDVHHVIGLVGLVREDGIQRFADAVDGIAAALLWGLLHVVERQQVHEVPGEVDGACVVLCGKVRDAGLRAVGHRSAEVFESHHFVGDRLDDLGSGDEHVRGLVHHDDEVRDGGAIDRATGAGAHDDRNLWDDAAGTDVAEENLCIGPKRCHAFLNASAT